jgi:hypothetical protein
MQVTPDAATPRARARSVFRDFPLVRVGLRARCRDRGRSNSLRRIKFFTRSIGVDFAEPLGRAKKRGTESAAARADTWRREKTMRPFAAPPGMSAAPSTAALAIAAVALAGAAAASLPLLDLISCMKLWQHGVAACLP